MFLGHYGLGYGIKKKYSDIPLWLLFTSVQLMDLLAFIFVLLGIEKSFYTPNENPFFRNYLHLPFSHSLSGSLIISILVFVLFWNSSRKKWAVVLALCVLSHWVIDLIVHIPDLSIFFNMYYVGFGLWNYPYVVYAIEILAVIVGWIIIKRRDVFSYILLFLMIGGFTMMVFGDEPEAMKQNFYLRTALVLVFNFVFIFLAYLSDRKYKI